MTQEQKPRKAESKKHDADVITGAVIILLIASVILSICLVNPLDRYVNMPKDEDWLTMPISADEESADSSAIASSSAGSSHRDGTGAHTEAQSQVIPNAEINEPDEGESTEYLTGTVVVTTYADRAQEVNAPGFEGQTNTLVLFTLDQPTTISAHHGADPGYASRTVTALRLPESYAQYAGQKLTLQSADSRHWGWWPTDIVGMLFGSTTREDEIALAN